MRVFVYIEEKKNRFHNKIVKIIGQMKE